MPAFRIYDGLDAVKPILLLAVLVCPLHADLIAHVQTTAGNVDVVLQYQKAPQAVANFVGLAQGTRARIHPETGAVIRSPMYVGETFYRIVNESSFKIAQTGSGTGTNSGGPGYTFKDEFDPTLTHVPYVLSMANSGPNTNGSQIFFTGNATASHLNNVHTVFGLITDLPSRGVIDAIHSAGDDGSSITGITFSRTDAAALAFNEHDQNLPICSGVGGRLEVNLGINTNYVLNQAQSAGSVIQAFRSPDLQSWSKLGEIYQGTGATGYLDLTFDEATLSRAFYNVPLVTYPDALAPASLANKVLVCGVFGNQNLTFSFDSNGVGGFAVYSGDAQPTPITGVNYIPSPYKATWIIETVAYNPFRFTCNLNLATQTHIQGTNKSEQSNGLFWSNLSSGSLSLTK